VESIHIRIPEHILRDVDRWAREHDRDRSSAIRQLIADGLDRAGLAEAVGAAVQQTLGRWALPPAQLADVAAGLIYAVMTALGRPSAEIGRIIAEVRETLEGE